MLVEVASIILAQDNNTPALSLVGKLCDLAKSLINNE